MTPKQRRTQITARLQDLLDTIPAGRGLPTIHDATDPANGPLWTAFHEAINGGPVPSEQEEEGVESTVREEAAFMLGQAVIIRAVAEARQLIAGTAPVPIARGVEEEAETDGAA